MSVRRLAKNQWQADVVCADGRRRRRNAATKQLAQRLEAQLRDLTAAQFGGHSVGTLAWYIEREWRPAQVDIRAATLASYEGHIEHYILPLLGDEPLGGIDGQRVRRFVLDVNDKGSVRYPGRPLSPQTVKRIYATLSVIMGMAEEDGLAAPLPRQKKKGGIVRLPRPTKPVLHVPTGAEAMRIIGAMDDRYRGAGMLGLAGMRLGEVLALTPRDARSGTLRIHRTVEKVTGQIINETKSGRERSITLPVFIRAELARTMQEYPDEMLVFHRDGEQVKHSWFWRSVWKPARERAGVFTDVRFQDLRHACASVLAANGASPKEVQEYLGHSTPEFTLRQYTHLWPDTSRGTGARLDGLDGLDAPAPSRTGTPIRAEDFESAASTSSATGAKAKSR